MKPSNSSPLLQYFVNQKTTVLMFSPHCYCFKKFKRLGPGAKLQVLLALLTQNI